MFLQITAKNLQNGDKAVQIDGIPDVCPSCHSNIHPKYVAAADLADRSLIQAIFRCTRQKCQELFIGTYRSSGKLQGGRARFALQKITPITPRDELFPEIIQEISPTFVAIYNQALSAESANLGQLVGIGLRKSLEFLIKDYAISQNPDQTETIQKSLLGKCINNFLDDSNIKECAKRAAWLGNDETHYIRKWDDKDIHDLKLLVKLTINWIENVLLTKKYIKEMNEGRT